MIGYRYFYLFIFFTFQFVGHAQKITVEKFELRASDISARTKPRFDKDGQECALIKVLSNIKELAFDEAVGDVTNQTNEYWVYISGGARKLTIRAEGVNLTIDFADYGIENAEAKTTYEMRLAKLSNQNSFNHMSIPSDFTIQAKSGEAEAECNLGKCHYLGQGTVQNFYAALTWFRKAADKNWPEAQYYIGRCFYYGQGVPNPDYKQAVAWYEKAANQEYADAQYQLGLCYEKGQGVKRDIKKARIWFEKAANNGNMKAMQKIQ
jgi:TPR repeat protein